MSDSSSSSTDGADADVPYYDPTASVPYWHQNMEIATICVTNTLTLAIIFARIVAQHKRFKRFRREEIWLGVAGVILIFPYWVCQIGMNRYGSGLHAWNVPDAWLVPYWTFSWGWLGYYIVVSMIKVSVCYSLLEILPAAFKSFRYLVYGLCVVIMSLGIANALVWLFQCQPFLSNFKYSVESTWCINVDITRYIWVGISIPIDMMLIWIPIAILQRTRLQNHERIVLMMIFGANSLGTIATGVSCYAIWMNRESNAEADLTYTETPLVMCNDIEILFYTIGGSLTVLSRFFIQKAAAYSHGSRFKPRTPSSGFSVFSKFSERIRKISGSASTTREHRPEDDFWGSNVTALQRFPGSEFDKWDHPPAMHTLTAMHPDHSRWHTWETNYGVPATRSHSALCIDRMGIIPDLDSPPRTHEESTERISNGTMWIDSNREPSDEEELPVTSVFSPSRHTRKQDR